MLVVVGACRPLECFRGRAGLAGAWQGAACEELTSKRNPVELPSCESKRRISERPTYSSDWWDNQGQTGHWMLTIAVAAGTSVWMGFHGRGKRA